MSDPIYMDLGTDCCNASATAIFQADDGSVVEICNGCENVIWMGQSCEGVSL